MTTTTWNIDPSHSTIAFSVRHMVFAKVRGSFTGWQGSIEMDPSALEDAKLEVRIDASSVNTNTEDRDKHLRSADFLDVEAHPEIHFVSTRVVESGADRYQVHGELRIKDVTREVVLDTELAGMGKDPWGNQRAGFTATASLRRSDFGLTWNQALEAGGVLVGDTLELSFDIQAVQAAATEAA